ncbi:MAG TPA: hypothetical protein VLC74_12805 [Rhizomicrobium sp.]|nr:hypothetical protein [Rhizomicrobium sp.]
MPALPALSCPACGTSIPGVEPQGKIAAALGFEGCHRRCERCGVGVSNGSDPQTVTFIYRNPLDNIPAPSRDGALETLGKALNLRNRSSKIQKFGFSTSEDAVTWVVFTYLLSSGRLMQALQAIGLPASADPQSRPRLLFWGVPVHGEGQSAELRRKLEEMCVKLGEDRQSFSEPDVIIGVGKDELMFIEVKHRSGHDTKPPSYPGWDRYLPADASLWDAEAVRQSGLYELARNWRLLHALEGTRRATLVNLGPRNLFDGRTNSSLERFVAALRTGEHARFIKAVWPDLLRDVVKDAPEWFVQFCALRGLLDDAAPSGL